MPSDDAMGNATAQFAKAKYLSLETFRKSGAAVQTPVWFAQDKDATPTLFFIYSTPDAGKVKRIRNNPSVRMAPCSVRGEIRGEWVEGCARLCSGAEAELGQRLLRRKYSILKTTGDFFSRLLGRTQTVIAIEIGNHRLQT
jgi:PPOX class probable F420-dependent enzyme